MAYTNNDNTLTKVSLAEFIKNQRPYKEARYFVGENIYISINKKCILLKNMDFLTNMELFLRQ